MKKALILLFALTLTTACQSEKQQACDCLTTKRNADNNYGGVLNYPRNVKIRINNCADRFDGYNNIRKLCNGQKVNYKRR